VSLCLAVVLALACPQASLAISGFATDGPAVSAQYPDAASAAPEPGAAPTVSSLRAVTNVRRTADHDPKLRAAERTVAHQTSVAVGKPLGFDAPRSGSIALLAALGVAGIGGLLRWRRGLAGV
jgi:hypothetical protein